MEVLKKRSMLYGVSDRIELKVMACENLGYRENSFDLIVGEWVLHHVMIDKCIPEIERVFKERGKSGLSWGECKQ